MGRMKGEPTKVERIPLKEARMIRAVGKKLGIPFRDAFRRLAGANIEGVYRRMKAGEHIELGEAGA